MIVTWLILQMSDTILRLVSKPVQPKTNAIVVSNIPLQRNSKHMRNNVLDRCGHVLSVIRNPKVMTNVPCTSTTGPSMKGGTCISALLTHAQLMATHMAMMNSTLYGGICRRTMGCDPPWVVLNVMAPSAANKASRNIYPPAQAKKINMAPNRHPMLRKSSNVTNVQRNTPQTLYYSSIRRCTKALTRSMCAASVVKVSVQPQPCTDMKRYIKITEHIKKSKPNSKFHI